MCDPTDACGSETYFNLFHHYYSLLLILCSFVMKKWHFLSFDWLKYLKLASHGLLNPVPIRNHMAIIIFVQILFFTTWQINIAASQACCSCWQIICGRMEGGRDNWKSTLTLSHQSEGWREDQSHWLTWIHPEPIPSPSMRATWEAFHTTAVSDPRSMLHRTITDWLH